jgi:hypothetical protein
MGFKTGGQQAIACNSKARSAVNGRCGTPSTTQCITSTLTGTTTTPPPTITLTINSMTATSINYTIVGGSTELPSSCSPVVNLVAANTKNTINTTNTNIVSAPYFNLQLQTNSQNIIINTPLSATLYSGTSQNNNTPFNQLPSGTYNVYLAYWNSSICPNYFITNNSTQPTPTTAAVSGYYTYTVS